MTQKLRDSIRYPMFRLAIAFAAGILLSDKFLPDTFPVLLLLGASVVCVAALGATFLLAQRDRYLPFGGCVLLFFLTAGMTLTQWHRQHICYAWPATAVLYQGTLIDSPTRTAKTYACRIAVTRCYDDSLHQYHPVERNALVYLVADSTIAAPPVGATLQFHTRLSAPETPDFLPFDYARYLFCHGISATGVVYDGCWNMLSTPVDLNFRQQAAQLRGQLVSVFRDGGLKGDRLAVVSALLLGEKELLTDSVKDAFSAAGVSHVLAISGLHVGILFVLFNFLFRPFSVLPYGDYLRSLLILLLLWGFAFITGLSPSVVRAVTMSTLYLLSTFLTDTRISAFHALYFTALLMLIGQPYQLFDIGFQLSFVAVFSILTVYPLLCCHFPQTNRPLRYMSDTLAVTLAAQVGTFPLVLYYFGTFPLYFFIGNLFVAPLVVFIIALSLLSLVCLPIPVLHSTVTTCLDWIIRLFIDGTAAISTWPCAQITFTGITPWQTLLLYLSLITSSLFFSTRKARHLLLFLIVLNVLTFISVVM